MRISEFVAPNDRPSRLVADVSGNRTSGFWPVFTLPITAYIRAFTLGVI
jgi:hypothetical protein